VPAPNSEDAVARDYYQALGVTKRATTREIKQAYRRLARRYHPDVTGDDPEATERFKEITEAYEVLSDPQKRRAYDIFGRADGKRTSGGGGEGIFGDFGDFGSVFESVRDIFTGSPRAPAPGADLELDLSISFEEAYRGVKKTIKATLNRPCSACDGKGAPKDAVGSTCPDCKGSGERKSGVLPFARSCPTCEGSGKVQAGKCKGCSGTGARIETDELSVTVPAGVEDGARLRLKGRGSAGDNRGPSGDLYVRIHVEPDLRFEREGDDIFTSVRIGLHDALLGSSVEVDLPVGTARITIPPGTQGGQAFRLRGKGMKNLKTGQAGDLYAVVNLRVPKQLDDEAKRLIEELKAVVPDL